MKIKTYLLAAGLVASSAISTYFVHISTAQQAVVTKPAIVADNEYQVGAILFMQKAAEYRALCYQAFNFGRWQLDQDFERKNVKKLPKDQRKLTRAVVVDVDETVLDNSPHQAELIKNRMAFDPDIWTAWVNRKQAKPIPGAVEFLKYANSKGVRVFYVTNRVEREKQATLDNLKQAGFPDVSEETLMVRASESTKEPRRQMIRDKKFRVVLFFGDNLNDFSNAFENKSVADRFAETDKAKDDWGKLFIVLPNVMYGDWESAIYENRRGLSEVEKTAKRANALESY